MFAKSIQQVPREGAKVVDEGGAEKAQLSYISPSLSLSLLYPFLSVEHPL
jgi:hypothetical protein